jgi:DNA-binding HxlR family transcriptional regulator
MVVTNLNIVPHENHRRVGSGKRTKAAVSGEYLLHQPLSSLERSMGVDVGMAHDPEACRAREVLDRIGDKWSVYVVQMLGTGTKRFSELRREIGVITPRMLTVTLRSLERDGLVTRTVYAVIPPRVEYDLTPLGATLLETVGALIEWANRHLAEIDAARVIYDRNQKAEPISSRASSA